MVAGDSQITKAEEGLIHLSNRVETRHFEMVGQLTDVQLGIFERKVIMGDATKDTDLYLSTWVLSDFTGGGQVRDLNETSDLTRYWWAVLDTRVVSHITLPPKVRKLQPSGVTGTTVRPLGDIGTHTYIAFGTDAYGYDGSTHEWLATANTLAATPVGKGREFLGKLYVPYGANGFDVLQETNASTGALTVTAGQAGLKPVDFAIHGYGFYAYCTDGTLWKTTDGSTWTQLFLRDAPTTPIKTLNGIPRKIFSYWDKAGIERLHMITSRDVWIYNVSAQDVERTALKWPPHPRFAYGAEVWRSSEDLWISAGDDIVKFAGSTNIVPGSGLRRDAGLPATHRGYITDLQGEMSALFVLVQGTTEEVIGETGLTSDELTDWDAQDVFDVSAAKSSLQLTNSSGWHCYWESESTSLLVTWMVLGAVDDRNYALWWGADDGYAYRLTQYPDFHNPLIAIESQRGEFADAGYLYSGKFDAQMLGFDKIASHAYIHWEHLPSLTEIKLSYQTDRHGWQDLGIAVDDSTQDDPGHHSTCLLFAVDQATGFSWGERFNWIEFRIDLSKDASLPDWSSPSFRAITFHYTKRPQNTTSLALILKLEDMLNGEGASEQYQWLKEQMEADVMLKLSIGRFQFRCRIAGIEKTGPPGVPDLGQVQVNFISIQPASL